MPASEEPEPIMLEETEQDDLVAAILDANVGLRKKDTKRCVLPLLLWRTTRQLYYLCFLLLSFAAQYLLKCMPGRLKTCWGLSVASQESQVRMHQGKSVYSIFCALRGTSWPWL